MKAIRPRAVSAALISAGLLTLSASGCSVLRGQAQQTAVSCPPPVKASALEILFDRDSPSARAELGTLVRSTARAGEFLLVIDADSGRPLGSFTAPTATGGRSPLPPAPLPADPTSYQRAKHSKAVAVYHAAMCRERSRQSAREHTQVAGWAARVAASLTHGSKRPRDSRDHGLSRSLSAAIADISSLQQARVTFGNRKVLAILGFDGASAVSAPPLPGHLPAVTVVVTGFPASPRAQQAWRTGMLRNGAAQVVVLTKSTSSELSTVVARGLGGVARS